MRRHHSLLWWLGALFFLGRFLRHKRHHYGGYPFWNGDGDGYGYGHHWPHHYHGNDV